MTSYIPGADNDLSMNFFLAKQSQNLEGFPSSVQKTLSTNLEPISCLACVKYCLNKSILKNKTLMNKKTNFFNCYYTCFLLAARFSIYRVKRETWFPRNVKL